MRRAVIAASRIVPCLILPVHPSLIVVVYLYFVITLPETIFTLLLHGNYHLPSRTWDDEPTVALTFGAWGADDH